MTGIGTRTAALCSRIGSIAMVAAVMAVASSAHAASCGSGGGGFSSWLEQFKRQAVAQGISAGTISSALGGVTYDPKVIRLDRSQRSFKLSFEQFYARRVSSSLIGRGRRYMAQHRELLDRMEKRFGVPGRRRHRHLGARDQLRLRQGRQPLDLSLSGHAGL